MGYKRNLTQTSSSSPLLPHNAPRWMFEYLTLPNPLDACFAQCHRISKAPLVSFVTGDWSVIARGSKKALMLPLDAYVWVGIRYSSIIGIRTICFCKNTDCNEWHYDPTFTTLSLNSFREVVNIIKNNDNQGIDIIVASELPSGYSLHEISSSILCLTSCLLPPSSILDLILQMSWQCMWYSGHSGATLLGALIKPPKSSLLSYDRSIDGNLPFVDLIQGDQNVAKLNTSEELIKNIRFKWHSFDVSQFSLIALEPAYSEVGIIQKTSQGLSALKSLEELSSDALYITDSAIKACECNDSLTIARMMSYHRTVLKHSGLGCPCKESRLEIIENDNAGAGAKTVCENMGGAILVLRPPGVEPEDLTLPPNAKVLLRKVSKSHGLIRNK